ncbi:MAG: hydrogenase iron-sulfur subunit [Deltaproteobacteria bacterium]|nr:MAG: hydrogenase iron-sulfur subunit [Deltaproteobacteria bacterium]
MNTNTYKRIVRINIRPKVVVFACNWGAFKQDDRGEIVLPRKYPGTNIIRIMCSGRLSPALILQAFELGADGVLILSCPEGECHYSFGRKVAEKNFTAANKIMRLLGYDEHRLRMEYPPKYESEKVKEIIDSFVRGLKELR